MKGMNWLDRAIVMISPEWGMRRLQAREALKEFEQEKPAEGSGGYVDPGEGWRPDPDTRSWEQSNAQPMRRGWFARDRERDEIQRMRSAL